MCVTFPLDGAGIAEPEFLTYTQPTELTSDLVGMTPQEFADALQSTMPDPHAEGFMQVSAEHRFKAANARASQP